MPYLTYTFTGSAAYGGASGVALTLEAGDKVTSTEPITTQGGRNITIPATLTMPANDAITWEAIKAIGTIGLSITIERN